MLASTHSFEGSCVDRAVDLQIGDAKLLLLQFRLGFGQFLAGDLHLLAQYVRIGQRHLRAIDEADLGIVG